MGSREGEDVTAVTTASEVQSYTALIVGPLERRYVEAKSGREGVAELGNGV